MFSLDDVQTLSSHDDLFAAVVFISIPVVAVSVGFLAHCYSTRSAKSPNSSEALMCEICAAHQLRSRDRRLLFHIAELADISPPTVMTAIPEVFDAAVQSAGDKQAFSRSQNARLGQIRNRLFGPAKNDAQNRKEPAPSAGR